MSGAPHTSTVHTLPPAPKRWSTEPVASWSPVQAQLAQTTVTLAARSQPRSLLLLLHSLPCRNAAAAFHVLCANFPSVPIVGIVIVLVFLHRRNNKKLAAEDAKDKYKSMDFGMGGAGKKGKGGPEMSITAKELRGNHGRGISLEGGSPYILPVGLHGSRESFHSLSRSHNDPHDPYRPVTFLNGDNQSIRSQGRGYGQDNQSLYTTRTTSSGGTQRNRMGDGLLKNAQRMSTSVPMRAESLSPDSTRSPDIKFPEQNIALSPLNPRFEGEPLAMPSTELPDSRNPPTSSSPANVPVISVPVPAAKQESTPTMPAYPARIQSQQAVVHEHANTTSIISTSSYGDGFQITPPSPRQSQTLSPGLVAPQPQRPLSTHQEGLGIDDFGHNTNRLSILRPLPPDDPEENPAQRAERIRSFYKEYFDDSKPEPVGGHTYTDYYEDYGSEYHQDGAVYDTNSRGFVAAQPNAPFAAPVTRRAMTPPPRAPPRFRSNTQTGPGGPRGPHMSNGSMASSHYAPRNMSSMSGRMAPPGPKKPLPPPSALSSLPTPAKLKEDAMVFNALDFAPPVSFRDRQNGMRPDSPLGSPRPFSPSVRPHTPLASSFDDLAVMPSPHMLRKSGLFTGLDFAPPPKFRDPGSNASDAGSIRSNRSGMSAVGRNAIANGANRVSKIPKEMVFTRDDMMNQLRPKMDLVRNQ
jgi:hypothetical protein